MLAQRPLQAAPYPSPPMPLLREPRQPGPSRGPLGWPPQRHGVAVGNWRGPFVRRLYLVAPQRLPLPEAPTVQLVRPQHPQQLLLSAQVRNRQELVQAPRRHRGGQRRQRRYQPLVPLLERPVQLLTSSRAWGPSQRLSATWVRGLGANTPSLGPPLHPALTRSAHSSGLWALMVPTLVGSLPVFEPWCMQRCRNPPPFDPTSHTQARPLRLPNPRPRRC